MNRAVYKFLLGTYGRKPGYWFGFVSEVIVSLVVRVFTVVIVARVAAAIAEGDITSAKRNVLIYFVAALLANILGAIGAVVALRAENEVYGGLIVQYYRKLTSKDMSFFKDNQTGYLATTMRQHVNGAMDLVRLLRTEGIWLVTSLVAPTIILLATAWQVGLVAVAIVAAQLGYIIWASTKAHKYRHASHEIYRKVSGAVSDDVMNIVSYKSAGRAKSSVQQLTKLADQEIETYWLRRRTATLLDLPRSVITLSGVSLAFWLVAISSNGASGDSVALIVLTITYMFLIFRNVDALPNFITKHDDLITQLYPTLEYIGDGYQTIRDRSTAKDIKFTRGAIELRNVTFRYTGTQGSVPVFRRLNLSIAPGEQVGVVGLSGAGKSTLTSLLMRFDDIEEGAILIDGTDIRDVTQESLRQQISFVPQEPLLFHKTIVENITYFKPRASKSEIERAAKAAHAHEFIVSLPNGYKTLVGERGVKLSGGQKQRVVLARSILKDAPIMIFDEATSALDSESEQIIQQALPGIIGKRTAIVIAHRLSTVANLDRIIVLEKGKIKEQGTHDELLKLRGRYYSLWQRQTANHKG